MFNNETINAEELVAQKSIPRLTIQSHIADVDRQISELNIKRKIYVDLLKEDDGSQALVLKKPRQKREGSGFRRSLAILAQYPDGLTVTQLYEKAVAASIDIKTETLSSQISKAAKNGEVRRTEDGKYVVV